MVYHLEWMEKPEGRKYRFWNTVSDTYVAAETDLEGAAEVLSSRYAIEMEEARKLVQHRATEDARVDAWAKVTVCGTCGGQWFGEPAQCCGKLWEPT